jgi:hypothetical protein
MIAQQRWRCRCCGSRLPEPGAIAAKHSVDHSQTQVCLLGRGLWVDEDNKSESITSYDRWNEYHKENYSV